MATMLWTGPDGITRQIPIPDTGAPDFIAGTPPNVYRTGLPVPVQGAPHVGVDPEVLGGQYQVEGFPAQSPNVGFGSQPPGPNRFGTNAKFGNAPKYTGTGSGGAATAGEAEAAAAGGNLGNVGKVMQAMKGNPLKTGAGGMLAILGLANMLVGKDGYKPTPGPGPIDDPYRAGQGLIDEANDPNTSPAYSAIGHTVGDVLQAPGRIKQGIGDIASNVGHSIQDAFTPQNILDQRKAAEASNTGGLTQDGIDNVLASVAGGLTGDVKSTPIDLGAAPHYDVPNLPLPDESTKTNYSELLQMVNQLRPEKVDNTELENTRGMAVLAGIAAGAMNAEPGRFGQTLLQMGLGGLAGHATIDAAENEAKDKFKNAMKEYVALNLKIAQAQHESDAEYGQRVYEAKLKQATMQWEADKLNKETSAPTLIKLENGKLALKTVDPASGHEVVNIVSDAGSQRFARAEQALLSIGTDPKIAKTTASLVMGSQPALELPLRAVGGMRSRGQTGQLLQVIGTLGGPGKDVVNQYNQFGAQAALGQNKEEAEREASAAQDVYLANVLRNKPQLLVRAMLLAGEDPNTINLLINNLKTQAKPPVK